MYRFAEFRATTAIAFLAIAGSAFPLAAQTSPTTEPAEQHFSEQEYSFAPDVRYQLTRVPLSPDSIDEELVDSAERPAGLFPWGPVSLVDPLIKKFNQETEKVGLNVGFSFTLAYQAATGGPGDRDAAGYDIDLFGNWRFLGQKDSPERGLLYFLFQTRSNVFTEIPPASLGKQIGSLWGTTFTFNDEPLLVKQLFWQQHIGNDALIIRIGKLDPEFLYNTNYWASDTKFFMNQAFSSFPVRAFPGPGLGANVVFEPCDLLYVAAGAQDAQGDPTEAGFNTFFDDFDLFGALEVGLTPTIPNVGKGTYRFTTWYRAAGESNGKPEDSGFDLSFDQHIGPHWTPFFKYGWGQGNINGISNMISTGIGWEGKLITPTDVLGVAGSWGQPSGADLRDQYALEAFYRLQLSPANQFTVGYQVIIDPTNAPDDHVVGVFEIRWRTAF